MAALCVAIFSYAAEPLKIHSFVVEEISPEADVYIAVLQTRHNGDADKVTLSYKSSNAETSIEKYDQYDIVNMGNATTTSITVTASDGVSKASSTYIYTRTDVAIGNYYTDRELWNKVAKPLLGRPAFKFFEGDESLPNVLIIGNSISIGYTPFVRQELAGEANIYRIPENSGSSDKAMQRLDLWLSDMKWDVIHINLGLHDLKYTLSDDHQDVPLDRYEENLRAIFAKLQATGAKVIWASTTYVPEGVTPRRDLGDDARYNAVARRVAKEFKRIEINDLYEASKSKPEWQQKANVHFTEDGYKWLGEHASKYIRKALK